MTEQHQLIPMAVGEQLRARRMKKRLGLESVAASLRIDVPVMRAMEADELAHLAPVYRRGYVQAYARFLGFKADEIAQMIANVTAVEPPLKSLFPQGPVARRSDRWLKATSYVMASLVIGTLAWQFSHEALRLSQDANTAGTVINPQDTAALARPSDAGEGHVRASIAAMENVSLSRNQAVAAGNPAWAAMHRDKPALPEGHHALQLTASGDSWVEITDADGQQLEMDLVRGGSSKQYQGRAPFDIQFGRASAVNLLLDGKAVDLTPHTQGDVTRLQLAAPVVESKPSETISGNG